MHAQLPPLAATPPVPAVGKKGKAAAGSALAPPVAAAAPEACPAWARPPAGWGAPAAGVALKCAALKALCRGCTPGHDAAPSMPPATVAVVTEELIPLLTQLLEVEPPEDADDEDGGGGGVVSAALGGDGAEVSDTDRALLRYCGASCLLWLARRHDRRMGPATHGVLGLAMQDPAMEVRKDFGQKVRGWQALAVQYSIWQLPACGRLGPTSGLAVQ